MQRKPNGGLASEVNEIEALLPWLVESKSVMVGGPRSGLYRLRAGSGRQDAAAAARTLAMLKARTAVFAFVGPVAAKP